MNSAETPSPGAPDSATTVSPHPRRRLLAAASALAALSGVGVAWWRGQSPATPPVMEPVPGFWSLRWDAPSGSPVSTQVFQGKPLLINFWATWCPPCVDELPLINGFFQQNHANGFQVLALAVDKAASVQSFLQKMPLDFPIGIAGSNGAELARALGNLAGGLPFSVLVGADGQVVQRKMGRLLATDLDNWARVK